VWRHHRLGRRDAFVVDLGERARAEQRQRDVDLALQQLERADQPGLAASAA
jgi:hypothetical protein